ncbi:flagellar type III secretion system protein FlhB [uncultured Sphingomonas sp.]|uniref:flagellar type III secretion system protein FlhB n=1 Tax=uncultured Sphingomonas sp. TaxID=158754 RepID=UPI0035CC7B7A
MADEFGEKTEAPTAKRRRDAVRDGNVLRSKDFGTALVVLAGVVWLSVFGQSLVGACKAVMAASLSFTHADIADFSPWRPLGEAGWKLAPSLAALFAMTLAATILGGGSLGALHFNGSLLAPKASRINPGPGVKRIFGTNGWIELGKSLAKVVLLGTIGGYMLWRASHVTIGLSSADLGPGIGALGGTFIGVLIAMAAGLAAIAGLDVPIQIVRLLAKLRMSKQEIKDEHKETEGSPEAKQNQRAKQRAMANRSIRKAVAEAHVVLTNPTHFAVALRYDRGRDQVPVVVARGRGATAAAIRELAGENRVPMLEYPMLARAVYYTSREGQEVRDDLYMALATVLAFVLGLNAKNGGTPPPVDVPPSARFDEYGVKTA